MILRGNIFSQSLMMDTGITILTPGNIGEGGPCAVTYLLHGVCGCNSNVIDYTMFMAHAAGYPSIFVMPDAHRSFYADMVYGQKFFTYIAEELPEICKSTFHISSRPADTYVMGISMGGYGALKCALAYPGRYAACCALSPGSLYLKDFLAEMREHDRHGAPLSPWGAMLIDDFRAICGHDFTWTPEIELLELARRIPSPTNAPRFYATCGDGDDLAGLNRQFARDMQELSFDYTYEEAPGSHDWYFFDGALKRALDFAFPQED